MTKVYGSRTALDQASFTLPQGAFLSVFGPNGAGKSTLLRLLSTLLRPSQGSASVLGYDLKEQADQIRASIGLISHRLMLYPDLSAEENLLFYARLYGLDDPEGRVAELLGLVELGVRRHDAVRGFSRGMAQRIAIARALLHDPHLLLLDEPYSGLDPRAAGILDTMLGRIRPGRSFLMVSHDLERGFSAATHLMVLREGRIMLFAERGEMGLGEFIGLYHELVEGVSR